MADKMLKTFCMTYAITGMTLILHSRSSILNDKIALGLSDWVGLT